MPLYEYQCQGCNTRQEVIQKFSDAPLTECADCGGELRKLISSPAIQFKGSGFYITDYARNAGASKTKTDTAVSGSTDAAGSSDGATSSEKETTKPSTSPAPAAAAPTAPTTT